MRHTLNQIETDEGFRWDQVILPKSSFLFTLTDLHFLNRNVFMNYILICCYIMHIYGTFMFLQLFFYVRQNKNVCFISYLNFDLNSLFESLDWCCNHPQNTEQKKTIILVN